MREIRTLSSSGLGVYPQILLLSSLFLDFGTSCYLSLHSKCPVNACERDKVEKEEERGVK